MTRRDAKMIAEEVVKLLKNSEPLKVDDLITAGEAAEILKISVGRFRHISEQFSRTRIGRRWLYKRVELNKRLIL